MKIFLQIVLVLLCVIFLLMSACGGFVLVMSSGFAHGVGDLVFPGVSFLVGAAGVWATVRGFKKIGRKKEPEA